MKEKTITKFVAIIVAITLLLTSFSTFSFAAADLTSTTTGTITIKDLESGIDVSIYKLTTVNIDNTAHQPTETPYTWKTGIDAWMTSKNAAYADPEKFADAGNTSSFDKENFYNELSAEIAKGDISFTGTETKTVTTTGTTATFTNCQMGTYLVVIKNGYKIYNPLVVNLTPKFNETSKKWELKDVVANSKSSEPSITKKMTGNKTSDNYSTNDEIEFTIEADVPKYLDTAKSKTYKITDTMTNGLTIVGDIKVEGLNESSVATTLGNPADYAETKGKKAFTLDFTYNNIKSYKKVKVTYKAKLDQNSNTELGEQGNTNTAKLTYSNSPYLETTTNPDKETPVTTENKNTVYTYGIEVTKIEKGKQDTKLAGAEFNLLSGTTALKFTKNEENGVYYLDNSGTETLVTDLNGLLEIYGLDEGTYTLKETKAPEGYNIATGTTEVKIVDTNKDGKLDAQEGQPENATGIYKVTFSNSKGFQLPVTGGMGTTLFVAGGIVLVGLGVALLIVTTKKNKNKDNK